MVYGCLCEDRNSQPRPDRLPHSKPITMNVREKSSELGFFGVAIVAALAALCLKRDPSGHAHGPLP